MAKSVQQRGSSGARSVSPSSIASQIMPNGKEDCSDMDGEQPILTQVPLFAKLSTSESGTTTQFTVARAAENLKSLYDLNLHRPQHNRNSAQEPRMCTLAPNSRSHASDLAKTQNRTVGHPSALSSNNPEQVQNQPVSPLSCKNSPSIHAQRNAKVKREITSKHTEQGKAEYNHEQVLNRGSRELSRPPKSNQSKQAVCIKLEPEEDNPWKGMTRIRTREVRIPKSQQAMLDREDSWLPPGPGSRGPIANIPPKLLKQLNQEADERLISSKSNLVRPRKSVSSQSGPEDGCSPKSNDSSTDNDDNRTQLYSWASTPHQPLKRDELPPDSSASAHGSQVSLEDPQEVVSADRNGLRAEGEPSGSLIAERSPSGIHEDRTPSSSRNLRRTSEGSQNLSSNRFKNGDNRLYPSINVTSTARNSKEKEQELITPVKARTTSNFRMGRPFNKISPQKENETARFNRTASSSRKYNDSGQIDLPSDTDELDNESDLLGTLGKDRSIERLLTSNRSSIQQSPGSASKPSSGLLQVHRTSPPEASLTEYDSRRIRKSSLTEANALVVMPPVNKGGAAGSAGSSGKSLIPATLMSRVPSSNKGPESMARTDTAISSHGKTSIVDEGQANFSEGISRRSNMHSSYSTGLSMQSTDKSPVDNTPPVRGSQPIPVLTEPRFSGMPSHGVTKKRKSLAENGVIRAEPRPAKRFKIRSSLDFSREERQVEDPVVLAHKKREEFFRNHSTTIILSTKHMKVARSRREVAAGKTSSPLSKLSEPRLGCTQETNSPQPDESSDSSGNSEARAEARAATWLKHPLLRPISTSSSQQGHSSLDPHISSRSMPRPIELGMEHSRQGTTSTPMLTAPLTPELPVSIYNTFTDTYPNYAGNLQLFVRACALIEVLVEEHRMEHRALWDDFIFLYATHAEQHGGKCDDIPYEAWFRENVDYCVCGKGVLNPDNLLDALQLDPASAGDMRYSIKRRFRELTRHQSVRSETSYPSGNPISRKRSLSRSAFCVEERRPPPNLRKSAPLVSTFITNPRTTKSVLTHQSPPSVNTPARQRKTCKPPVHPDIGLVDVPIEHKSSPDVTTAAAPQAPIFTSPAQSDSDTDSDVKIPSERSPSLILSPPQSRPSRRSTGNAFAQRADSPVAAQPSMPDSKDRGTTTSEVLSPHPTPKKKRTAGNAFAQKDSPRAVVQFSRLDAEDTADAIRAPSSQTRPDTRISVNASTTQQGSASKATVQPTKLDPRDDARTSIKLPSGQTRPNAGMSATSRLAQRASSQASSVQASTPASKSSGRPASRQGRGKKGRAEKSPRVKVEGEDGAAAGEPVKWWMERNTPLKQFIRNYVALKSVGGELGRVDEETGGLVPVQRRLDVLGWKL